jgi:hypothetical protein
VLAHTVQGYAHHPQLIRFRNAKRPLATLDQYLWAVFAESQVRGYHFNSTKLGRRQTVPRLTVTTGQLAYETAHLRKKLARRDRVRWKALFALAKTQPHPSFRVRKGGVESWERPSLSA